MPLLLSPEQQKATQAQLAKTSDTSGITLKDNTLDMEGLDLNALKATMAPIQSTTSQRKTTKQNMAKIDERNAKLDETRGATTTPTTPTTPAKEETIQEGIAGQIALAQKQAKKQIEDTTATLSRLSTQLDSAHAGLISAIQSKYSARIANMEQSNKNLIDLKTAVGQRAGRERYASVLQGGILTDEEQAGNQRIATLEGEMLSLVAQANQAKTENDVKMFNAKAEQLDKINKEMTERISQLYKTAVEQEKIQQDKIKQEQLAQKQEFESMLDMSERVAPSIAESTAGMSAKERQAVIELYAEKAGIDPELLLGDVSTASLKRKETVASINQKNRSNADGGTGKLTEAEKTRQDASDIAVQLNTVAGADGKLSPQNYQKARKAWVSAGYTGEDFDQRFARVYVNTEHFEDYGVDEKYVSAY